MTALNLTLTRRKSPLAIVEKVTTKNKNIPRSKPIRRLTPHHVAANATVEAVLGLPSFNDGRTASASYAIGSDGRMGLGVEETNAPWSSSSSFNDSQAITFEIANITTDPDWRMSDAAINMFLNAAVEICKFYGYAKVAYQEKPATITGGYVESWIATWAKDDEMIITLHNWFAPTACPGPYFTRQLPWLVREMNKRLSTPGYTPEAFVGEGSVLPLLRQGSVGEEVKLAQQKLNAQGAAPALNVDGDFGPLTGTAVKSFQKGQALDVDGIIGPMTWAKLNAPVSTNTQVPYLVRVNIGALNIRTAPTTTSSIVRTLLNDKNVYTIVEDVTDSEGNAWGKLKSGEGWVLLSYTIKA